MATQNEIQKPASNPIAAVRNYLANPDVKKRFEEMLGKRAGSFCNSVINIVKNNKALQECSPDSIMTAALSAASMNLPIDSALGFAAIVPYKNRGGSVAQFQIMCKGVVQLCIRSGQYVKIHNQEIYADELKTYNPITGEVQFNDPSTFKMRYEGNPDGVINPKNVVGVYAYFKLSTGFECSAYMSKSEALAHGRRFSKAYQYDLRENKQTSLWSTDPISMCKKTVLKMLLSKYGIMSIELQEAFVEESQDFNDAAQEADKNINADAGSEVIELEPMGASTKTVNEPEPVEAQEEELPDFMKAQD